VPLEFPCPHCQHLLRTADDKAGLSATCPACGESIWVPYAHELAARTDQPPPPAADLPATEENAPEEPLPGPSISETRDADVDEPFAADVSVQRYGRQRGPTCEHCGTENDADARQCRACGADLPPAQEPAAHDAWQPRDPDIGEVLQSSWKIFIDEIGLLIGAMLLVMLVSFGIAIVCFIPAGIGAAVAAAIDNDLIPLGIGAGLLVTIPLVIAASAAIQIGYYQLNLNVACGRPAGIGDLFYGFGEGRSQILPLIVVGLLCAIAVIFTCYLGSFIVWPFGFLVVHRRTDTGEGVSMGFELLQKEFVNILLVGLVIFGINAAIGMLNMCFYIGLILMIFAVPYIMMLEAVGYLRIERERTAVDRD
jgi:zinc-ribbon domain